MDPTKYMRQVVTHERYLGLQNGTPKFAASTSIPARYVPSRGKRYTDTGTEITTESTVLTASEIEVGDKIEGKTIRRIEALVGKDGAVLAYWGFM